MSTVVIGIFLPQPWTSVSTSKMACAWEHILHSMGTF
jgi:hypothetical protein